MKQQPDKNLTPASLHQPGPARGALPVDAHVLAGKKILVVDDNKINHRLMTLITRNWAVQLLFALNGQEAMELLEKEPADIVLTDMYMDMMDGLALLEAIRGHAASFHSLPVVLVSASCYTADEINELKEKGFSEVLSRPFTEGQLVHTIQTLLHLPAGA
jgi:CheY-like chemotaxis protein